MKRYYWIMMTYVTRPTMWVLALLVIGTLTFAITEKSDSQFNIEVPIITAMVMLDLAAVGMSSAKRKYVGLEWGRLL